MSKTNRLLLMMNVLLSLILVLVLIQFMPKPANAATGDISACANKKTGALRLATKACTKKETPVSWGATGPAGPAGPAGASSSLTPRTISYYTPAPFSCGLGQNIVTSVDISSFANPLDLYEDINTGYLTDVVWRTFPSILSKSTSTLQCRTITVYGP